MKTKPEDTLAADAGNDTLAAEPAIIVGPGEVAVTFRAAYEVQDEHRGTAKATIYLPGKVYALPEASAQHFIGRGKADPIAI